MLVFNTWAGKKGEEKKKREKYYKFVRGKINQKRHYKYIHQK